MSVVNNAPTKDQICFQEITSLPTPTNGCVVYQSGTLREDNVKGLMIADGSNFSDIPKQFSGSYTPTISQSYNTFSCDGTYLVTGAVVQLFIRLVVTDATGASAADLTFSLPFDSDSLISGLAVTSASNVTTTAVQLGARITGTTTLSVSELNSGGALTYLNGNQLASGSELVINGQYVLV